MRKLELNAKWIQDIENDINSSATTVAVVETSDPARERQFHAFATETYPAFFLFSPWKGLEQFNKETGRFVAVTVGTGSEYDASLRNELRDMSAALRHMDTIMRNQTVAFVIRGVDRCDGALDKNTDLVDAFRDWAQDEHIINKKSLICLFSAQPERSIDKSTLELATLVRPPLASEQERLEIVRSVVSRATVTSLEGNEHRVLAVAAAGLNLHQTRTVLLKTYNTTGAFAPETIKHYKSDHIRRSDIVEIEEPMVTFNDVGGYEGVKKMVENSIIEAMENPDGVARAALPLPRGLLLYGPPGTGKTLFAKALARETNLPFINLKTENLFTSLLGETGQRLRDAIRISEQAAPAFVFVDEIDRFGQRGSGGKDGASQETNRVFSQLLEWLGDENRRAIVLGTTNVPEHLDEAFLRSGRFSYIVPFLYPNRTARLQILRLHLGLAGNRRRPVMDENSIQQELENIANLTDYYSGADLEELVIRAKRLFFEENGQTMTGKHLNLAHKDFRVPESKRKKIIQQYESLGDEFANSLAMLQTYDKESHHETLP